jgi:response regulator NasT
MRAPAGDSLRVLLADERPERLAAVSRIVIALGHEVAVASCAVGEVGALTRRERPDVALVAVGEDTTHALAMIDRIVHEAACPVIVALPDGNPGFVAEAARRGVFAYLVEGEPEALQGVLEIALRRFAEYHGLEGAFGRRAVTERAKGILMERHHLGEQEAFTLLRSHARQSGRKLADVAEAVLASHLLLPGTAAEADVAADRQHDERVARSRDVRATASGA